MSGIRKTPFGDCYDITSDKKIPCPSTTHQQGSASHHNAGGPTSQLGKNGTKHHADAVAAKKKSKRLLYSGIGLGVVLLGLAIHHFTKKHHKA